MKILNCISCSAVAVPPAYICPSCGGTEFQPEVVVGRGRLYSFTVIHVPPVEFKGEAPYYYVVIKLEKGPLVPGRLLEPVSESALTIDAPVEFVAQSEKGPLFSLCPA